MPGPPDIPYSTAEIPVGGNLYAAEAGELIPLAIQTYKPFSAGFENFQVMGQSFANGGGGAGTYNHAMFYGWNAGVHTQTMVGWTSGKPSILMGFEDNYFDTSVGDYSVEWYVEYWSPDGTSVQLLRPFYCRLLGSHGNTANNFTIHMDIGTDGTGVLGIYAGLGSPPLFTVTPTLVQATKNWLVTGNGITLSPAAGQPMLTINRNTGGGPTIAYQFAGTTAWFEQASSATVFQILDSNARAHAIFTMGATAATAITELSSKLRIDTLPAFVAADKYLVADSSGNVHVSALGPAS